MLMDDAADSHVKYAHNGQVMLGSAILLFLIVLVIIFLHTYRHLCFSHRRRRHRHTPHLHLTSYTTSAAATHDKGLDPSLFKFLPTFTYSSANHRHKQECVVCLSEFEDDDQGRVLPNCNHAFHSHCIDTWFLNHSNCPLCRIPVRQPAAPVQPPKISSVSASSNTEPLSSEHEPGQTEEGLTGSSSLPTPIGCPRKPLDAVGLGMVGVIVEFPEEEDERRSGSEWMRSAAPVDRGFKGSDHRMMSLSFCG